MPNKNVLEVNGSRSLYARVVWWMTEYDEWKNTENCENPDLMKEMIEQGMDIFHTIYESGVYERNE